MKEYKCPRCLYITKFKGHIRKHIHSKLVCARVSGGLDVVLKDWEDVILGNINPFDYFKLLVEHPLYVIEHDTPELKPIIINDYNKPYTDYIEGKHCDKVLRLNNFVDSCISIIKFIWMNPAHPENHSIFKMNKRDNSIKCFESGSVNEYTFEFKFKDILNIITDVLDRNESESDKYYDLVYILDNPEDHKVFYKELESALYRELYNHKEISLKSIKTINKYSI